MTTRLMAWVPLVALFFLSPSVADERGTQRCLTTAQGQVQCTLACEGKGTIRSTCPANTDCHGNCVTMTGTCVKTG